MGVSIGLGIEDDLSNAFIDGDFPHEQHGASGGRRVRCCFERSFLNSLSVFLQIFFGIGFSFLGFCQVFQVYRVPRNCRVLSGFLLFRLIF